MNNRTGPAVWLAAGCALLLLLSCGGPRNEIPGQVKEISFTSGPFKLAGELTTPAGRGRFPVVLLVHGDGPGTRADYAAARGRMLRAGYATFIWDKPGSGGSTGAFDEKRLLSQRARILCDALEAMKEQPEIDSRRMGVWGISQGGYVMSMALGMTPDVAFVVAVSCPGESGARQASYLVKSFAECEGAPEEVGAEIEDCVLAINSAATYEEYVACSEKMKKFDGYLKELSGGRSGPRPRGEWDPSGPEYFYDPMANFAAARVPILALFGENDRQADPVQGVEAFSRAIAAGGSKLSRVVMVPGVDHVLVLSPTGCIQEWQTRTDAQWDNHSPTYLGTMERWLAEVRERVGR